MRVSRMAAVAATLALDGCATTGGGDGGSAAGPNFTPVPGQAVSGHGYLVIACVNQAIQNQTFDMVGETDGDNRMIRFTCDGGPAVMLFNALAERSAAIGSEWTEGTAVHRSTERVERDLYGSDICTRDGDAHHCRFNLNLGGFIKE